MNLPVVFEPGTSIIYKAIQTRQWKAATVRELYRGVYPTPSNPDCERWYVRLRDQWDGTETVFAADILINRLDLSE